MNDHAALDKPLVIGIAGGSGSGKTTVAQRIVGSFRPGDVTHIQHDAYYRHRPDLNDAERRAVNYDHPDSLDNGLLIEQLDTLIAGGSVEMPEYDFVTHLRKEPTKSVDATPIVLIEGILIFADPALTERMDVRLFVDTPPDIRVLRRVRRDMRMRGRTFEEVRQQYYETVRPMHIAFVEPSKSKADLIIPEGGNNAVAIGVIVERIRSKLIGREQLQAPHRHGDYDVDAASSRRE